MTKPPNDDREAYEEESNKPKWDERGDEYITTPELDFCSRTAGAVLVDWWDDTKKRRISAWVPRRCLHHNTDTLVGSAKYGQKIQLKVMKWVAKQKGLPI